MIDLVVVSRCLPEEPWSFKLYQAGHSISIPNCRQGPCGVSIIGVVQMELAVMM